MSTNWVGFWTLLYREFMRFFKVPNNTIVPQMVTVLFYFLIFGVAIGSRIESINGVPYLLFILPGLFVQNLINGSYSNASGSLFVSRIVGNSIQDVLLAPISYMQFTLAYVIASMLRGIFLALATIVVFLFFMRFSIAHWDIFLAYSLLTAFAFACWGIIIGLWAKNWDQLNIFINFVVTPLTFLGGVFYTLDMVPPVMRTITQLNPIFYMINGTRYGMIGVADGNVYIGLGFLALLCIVMFVFVHSLVRRGYHLRT